MSIPDWVETGLAIEIFSKIPMADYCNCGQHVYIERHHKKEKT